MEILGREREIHGGTSLHRVFTHLNFQDVSLNLISGRVLQHLEKDKRAKSILIEHFLDLNSCSYSILQTKSN